MANLSTDQELDCAPPGTTKEQKIDVLERLHAIHRKMHAGKNYSFEQTILCDTVREIETLRAALKAIARLPLADAHSGEYHVLAQKALSPGMPT